MGFTNQELLLCFSNLQNFNPYYTFIVATLEELVRGFYNLLFKI